MTSKSFLSALNQVFFGLGLAAMAYGIALWSRPLAYVICGFLVASLSFLVGYKNLDRGSGR